MKESPSRVGVPLTPPNEKPDPPPKKKDRAVSFHTSGRNLFGTVKGVDAGNNTITLTVKDEEGVNDRTFMLAKGLKVDGGRLADLTEGTPVSVRLSVLDKQTAVAIHTHKGERRVTAAGRLSAR